MEDGEAIELVHRSIRGERQAHSFVAMGADEPIQTTSTLVSEIPIRGFWKQYTQTMGIEAGSAV
jgi:hypothetical protein